MCPISQKWQVIGRKVQHNGELKDLSNLDSSDTDSCRFCEAAKETSYNVLREWVALCRIRYQMFGGTL